MKGRIPRSLELICIESSIAGGSLPSSSAGPWGREFTPGPEHISLFLPQGDSLSSSGSLGSQGLVSLSEGRSVEP